MKFFFSQTNILKLSCFLLLLSLYACNRKPEADFEIKETVYIQNNSIQLINKSVNADKYLWKFPDASSSEEKDPVYKLKTAGKNTITLTSYNTKSEKTSEKSEIIDVQILMGKFKFNKADTQGSSLHYHITITGIDDPNYQYFKIVYGGCNDNGRLCNSSCPEAAAPPGKYELKVKIVDTFANDSTMTITNVDLQPGECYMAI
jgi:PKD repeat protein